MNPRSSASFALALFLALLPVGSRAAPLRWSQGETIVSGVDELRYPLELHAAALQSQQHMVYFNETQHRLGYGHRQLGVWSHQTITPTGVPESGDFSLCLWENVPIVVYYDDSSTSLQFIRGAGSGWTPSSIPGTAGVLDMKAATSPGGDLHVLWVSSAGPNRWLNLTYWAGSSWVSEPVALVGGSPGGQIAIAVDQTDVAHAAWYDPGLSAVQYAYRTGPSSWIVETVAPSVDTCFWVDLEILAPDVPYIGFLDYPGGDDIVVRSASRATGVWLTDLRAPGLGWVFGSSMALARAEGANAENRYFVFGLSQDFNYSHRRGGGWFRGPIDPLDGYPLGNVFDLAWDPVNQEALLVFHGPSDREITFFVGTPVVDEQDLVLDLVLDQAIYSAGDEMSLGLDIENPGVARAADLYVLLEVAGEFWFWPGWSQSMDHYVLEILDLWAFNLIILPTFTLPTPLASGGPFYFHTAAFEPGPPTSGTLTSNVDTKAFSFE